MAMSRFVEPAGFVPTMVLGSASSVPSSRIENPAIDEVPAFDAYTNRPSGVTTFQQFAAPSVGTLALIGSRDPSDPIEYDEIAELFGPPPPVSDTMAVPCRANVRENAPGPTLGV